MPKFERKKQSEKPLTSAQKKILDGIQSPNAYVCDYDTKRNKSFKQIKIPAREIEKRLDALDKVGESVNKLEISNVQITGSINLSRHTNISALIISDVRFWGGLNMTGAELSYLKLSNVSHSNDLIFSKSLITNEVILRSVKAHHITNQLGNCPCINFSEAKLKAIKIEPNYDNIVNSSRLNFDFASVETDISLDGFQCSANRNIPLVSGKRLNARSIILKNIEVEKQNTLFKAQSPIINFERAQITTELVISSFEMPNREDGIILSRISAEKIEIEGYDDGNPSTVGGKLLATNMALSDNFASNNVRYINDKQPIDLSGTSATTILFCGSQPKEADKKPFLCGNSYFENITTQAFWFSLTSSQNNQVDILLSVSKVDSLVDIFLPIIPCSSDEQGNHHIFLNELRADLVQLELGYRKDENLEGTILNEDAQDANNDPINVFVIGDNANINTSIDIELNQPIEVLQMKNIRTQRLEISGQACHRIYLSGSRIEHLKLPEISPIEDFDLSNLRVDRLEDFSSGWGVDIYKNQKDCKDDEWEHYFTSQGEKGLYENNFKINPMNLNGFTYNHLINPFGKNSSDEEGKIEDRIKWLERQSGFRRTQSGKRVVLGRFNPFPWKQLAITLQGMGYDEDARRVTIERRRAYRASKDCSLLETFWLHILDATGDFGFNPGKTIKWALFFIAAFATFYFLVALGCNDHMNCDTGTRWVQTTAGAIGTPDGKDQLALSPKFNPFIYSIDQFIPLIDFGYASKWAPDTSWQTPITKNSNLLSGKILEWLIFLERILGAFLTPYAVIGLSGIVKREE